MPSHLKHVEEQITYLEAERRRLREARAQAHTPKDLCALLADYIAISDKLIEMLKLKSVGG